MPNALAQLMEEDRRAKLAREYSHPSSGYVPSRNEIQRAINVGTGKVSRDVAYGEKPLGGGFDLFEIGGIPINATDLIPADLGVNALAKLMSVKGLPLMAGIFAGKGAKTANLANLMKAEELKATGVPDVSQFDVPVGDQVVRYGDDVAQSTRPALPYQIEHKPMTIEGGAAPLHDLTGVFGDDIYGKNALQYFGSGDPREAQTLKIMRQIRGNPNAMVTIYRGAPVDAGKINAGDWVTLDRNVAQDYVSLMRESEGKAGKIYEMKVPARDITSWPDSLLEFGYHPKDVAMSTKSPTKLKVFHGSKNDFDVFDPNKAKTAQHIYTTDTPGDASQYGKVAQFEANVSKPIDLSGELNESQMAALESAAREAGLIDEYMPFGDWYEQIFQPGQMYQYYGNQSAQNAVLNELYAKGYDAVKIPDAGFGGAMSSSWVFENPNILKKINNNPTKTEFELSHEVAQRNAALPVEQGGLGLSPDNTAMDRAKAMGFDTPAYHGTGADIKEFNSKLASLPDKNTEGVAWFSSSPEVAGGFAGSQRGETIGGVKLGHSNLLPVVIRGEKLALDPRGLYAKAGGMDNAEAASLIEEGYSGIRWPESSFDLPDTTMQGPVTGYYRNRFGQVWGDEVPYPDQYGVIIPSNIRSRFAAFDPMQRNSANILAGGAAGGIGINALYQLMNQDEYQ
ncbi:DNA repair protein [Caudoviricetes sp.]|nr:DNA repair protein [Caudoviricetes sp.]